MLSESSKMVYEELQKTIINFTRQSQNGNFDFSPKPTFTEFVQYILNENELGKTLNEHWIPVYKFCNPCQV